MTIMLADEHPTARTEHRCSACGRVIFATERYRRTRLVGDDGPQALKQCAHCEAVLCAIYRANPWLYGSCEGVDLGEWLHEYEIEPLLSQWRTGWRDVLVADLDLSVVR